jgi:hypothetical protein
MDGERFDRLTRAATQVATRRGLLRSGAFGLTGVLGLRLAELGSATARHPLKNNHHHGNKGKGKGKGKQPNGPKPNAFGCLNVGQHCRGQDSKCCSGICKGQKPKPGKPDRSRCVGHNQGSCLDGTDYCAARSAATQCTPTALCLPTTGNGTFCGEVVNPAFNPAVNCKLCNRDSDCIAAGFPGSACVFFSCSGLCAATQNRACLPPGA